MPFQLEIHTIKTTCTRDCQNTCGLLARVEKKGEEERLTSLVGDPDHPFTKGVACHKAMRYVRRVYSPERVRYPLIKKDGHWRRIGWDDALGMIAAKLKTIIAADGPEAILYYQGFGERTALKLLNSYFFNLLGGVSTLYGTVCGGTGQASQNLDVGERISHDPLDHYNSKSMILWGRNPASTNVSLLKIIKDIQARGGRVALVDPVRSRSASLTDRHLAPRPMSDAFLAFAVAKRILEAGKADLDFMRAHTKGFEQYLALLERFSLEDLCRYCDLPLEDIDYLADMFTRFKPTSVLLGWGLHRHEYAHYSIRAIDALGAISGNLGVAGGGVSQGFEEYAPYDQRYWGHDLHPQSRRLLMPRIGEEILKAVDPPIRMIVVSSANPVCMAPDSAKVAKAFKSAEFVVYVGHFLDDTADCATLFLPATTFVEEDDVVASYGHNYTGPVSKAIEPLGECRSEFQIFQDLARHFPFAQEYCRSLEDWLQDICSPLWAMGCNPEKLKKAPFRLHAPMVPYAGGRFPTRSGKFLCLTDIAPEILLKKNPVYPYRFMSIAAHDYICSERTLQSHDALPELSLAASEAVKLGLADGDRVDVESLVGAMPARLRLVEGQRPDVAVMERGGWIKAGHGANLLTLATVSQVGNGTPYYETSVRVRPSTTQGGNKARILLLQNYAEAPAGAFGKELERQGCALDVVHAYAGGEIPASADEWGGLLVLGGLQDAYDDAAAYLQAEMRLMRDFDAQKRPVAGICLGAQLLSRAHGGTVYKMDRRQFGYTDISLNSEGRADPVFASLNLPLLMEHHQDTFTLPPGGILLASSANCANEAFKVGNCSYGFQFHPEVNAETLERWVKDHGQEADEKDRRAIDYIMENFPVLVQDSAFFCSALVQNWLNTC